MDKPKLGFVGLGIMGLPMAGHLLEAGYPLTIYNRTPEKTAALVGRGAGAVGSPAKVAAVSEIIVVMVSDSPDVEEVVAGPNGLLDSIRPNSVVIDMSTISPAVERRLSEELKKRGCQLIDAPVSGGDSGARNATLAIMAGGEREAFERVLPVLSVMGKSITYCGPIGNGQLTKLCNQVLVSTTLLGVCEALQLATGSGLDPKIMIEAVKGGAAGSWQLSNLGPKIVADDFAPGFMIDLIQKDLRLVTEVSESARIPLPSTALVRQLFLAAQAAGSGRSGTQALAQVLEKMTESNQ